MVDDSHLTITLCEEASADDEEKTVPVHPACCDCEAEYSLIFQVIFIQQAVVELYSPLVRVSGVRRHIHQIFLTRSGC